MKKQIKFNAPALSYLSNEDINKIHHASIKILEQTGCKTHHPGVLDLLKSNGAKTGPDDRVYIPKNLIEWAIEKAPSKITIYNRDKKPALLLEKNNVYYGTGSDCQYLLDIETGKPKDFTFKEMQNAVRIADSLPYIDFISVDDQFLIGRKAFCRHTLTIILVSPSCLIISSGIRGITSLKSGCTIDAPNNC